MKSPASPAAVRALALALVSPWSSERCATAETFRRVQWLMEEHQNVTGEAPAGIWRYQ